MLFFPTPKAREANWTPSEDFHRLCFCIFLPALQLLAAVLSKKQAEEGRAGAHSPTPVWGNTKNTTAGETTTLSSTFQRRYGAYPRMKLMNGPPGSDRGPAEYTHPQI